MERTLSRRPFTGRAREKHQAGVRHSRFFVFTEWRSLAGAHLMALTYRRSLAGLHEQTIEVVLGHTAIAAAVLEQEASQG